MKSILVDALRQAGGRPETTESEHESENSASADDAASHSTSAASLDLEILEPDSADHRAQADAESGRVIDAQANFVASNDDGKMTDSIERQVTARASESGSTMQMTTRLLASGADLGGGRTFLLDVARLSPLLCLVFASTAAGGYLLYRSLVTQHLEAQLSSVADRTMTNRLDSNIPASGMVSPFSFRHESLLPPTEAPAPPTAESPLSTLSIPAVKRPIESAVSAASVSQPGDEAYQLVLAAYENYRNGRMEDAERGYRSALEVSPNHAGALEGLAAVLMKTDRAAQAMRTYESLLAVEPSNTSAAAALLAGSENLPANEAEREVKLMLQRHPISASLNFSLGTLYAKNARWPEARQAFARACSLEPANADYLFNLAVSLEHIGRTGEAKNYYRHALEARDASSTVEKNQLAARLATLETRSGGPR